MFKFLHAADIHLDSALRGLEQYETAPVDAIRHATRRALENMVDLAISQSVQFVLIAGDVYDRDWPDYNTGVFYVNQMNRLREAGIPVVTIAGNHDAANKMTRSLRTPDNVTLLSTDQPQTLHFDDWGVAIHGQGFASGAVLEDLSAQYPRADAGLFNIGLLHTCATGYEGHDPYAPCTIGGLKSKQYNYWALGHIHTRNQNLSDNPELPIVFPGNLQGRHIRETGKKGCVIVTVDDRHRVASLDFQPVDVFRWQRCIVSASGAAMGDEVMVRVQNELRTLVNEDAECPLAVRVEIEGGSSAHDRLLAEPQRWTSEVRVVAADTSDALWIEKVKWNTTPHSDADPPARDGALAELETLCDELRVDDARIAKLGEALSDLQRALPTELTEGDLALHLDDPAQLRKFLAEAQSLLFSRLQLPSGNGK